MEPEEVRVNVKSTLTDVSILGIVKGKDVRAETLNLVVDNNGMSVIGDAQLDGIPLHLVWDDFADFATLLVVERGRRTFFDDFLVAALD